MVGCVEEMGRCLWDRWRCVGDGGWVMHISVCGICA